MASSTDTVPSGSSTSTEPEIKYLDTASAYDLWSSVYDTDNNFLQALDSFEMKTLFPELISTLESSNPALSKPWKLVDLGCGTGRNTIHLASLPAPDVDEIYALDLSPRMLDLARERLKNYGAGEVAEKVKFQVFNVMNPSDREKVPKTADAIISTLVLEHVPLVDYFPVAAGMLKVGGLLLLTNMHGDMGKISQAGFVDPTTGEKIRPLESYAYSCDEVRSEAERFGFEMLSLGQKDGFEEKMVTNENHELFGPRAAKWIGVRVWFGGILRKVR
ncbi:S-adenosyl-L-methionine-dependent methyltransferase [Rhypophila decipiens]|uniref:S-adenosyl-L-methionine-dependent methyltransferase n=1 Tax=Rhypophila decipiens TaxID=261697 RepID=A0AAN6Y316_9PEZI|nr:S-adenosyl-L-methionine-dependent methyltransferase [Rhypophila decipiens]